jgi:hypothetical protein
MVVNKLFLSFINIQELKLNKNKIENQIIKI